MHHNESRSYEGVLASIKSQTSAKQSALAVWDKSAHNSRRIHKEIFKEHAVQSFLSREARSRFLENYIRELAICNNVYDAVCD